MSGMAANVALYTIESIPVREYLGAVTFWARDESLDAAETRALAGLREQAAAMGGDAVIGLRIETEQELAIGSESRAGSTQVLVSSRAAYRVNVAGTAAVIRAQP